MAAQSSKWSRLTIILAIVSMFCFMFAGSALAGFDNVLTVNVDGVLTDTAYTGCNDSYTFDVSNINSIQANCFNNDAGIDLFLGFRNKNTLLDYNSGFQITTGLTVPVKILLSNGQWYYAQPEPQLLGSASAVKLHIPDLLIPEPLTGIFVQQIVVGDGLQSLQVKNPCVAGAYCVDLWFDSACVIKKFTSEISIKSAPYSIDAIVECNKCEQGGVLACEDCVVVKGTVYDCGQAVVGKQAITVTVGGVTVNAVTDMYGKFNVPVNVRLAPGSATATVTAANPCNPASPIVKTVEFTVFPNAPTGVTLDIVSADGIAGQVRFNKCNIVTITVRDDCGNPAVFNEPRDIFLSAYTKGTPPVVAGHFYNYSQVCPSLSERDAAQIGKVTLPAGQSSVQVYLIPLVEGQIYVEAKVDGLSTGEIPVTSYAPATVDLEITPLVTDSSGNPRAGWPMAAAVRLDRTSSEPYEVTFDVSGLTAGTITADESLEAAFNCSGDLAPETFPYCTSKAYFYLYPSSDARGTISVTVNLKGQNGTISDTFTLSNPFVSPVELQRAIQPDAWQTFSTPKWLANTCDEAPVYGTFREFLPFKFSQIPQGTLILKYKGESGWEAVTNLDQQIEPLVGYYVRTPQREEMTKFTLDYVFARATDPSHQIPHNTYLGSGWNTIGVSVSPSMFNTLTLQSEEAYRAFGSLVEDEDATLAWNPGQKVGNVANPPYNFTTMVLSSNNFNAYYYEGTNYVYNGDLYWLYCDGENFSANLGLEIIEWIGGTYQATANDGQS